MIVRLVPSPEALERAAECRAGRSRSHVDDARYFAGILLAIGEGRVANGVVRAPIVLAVPPETR